jgi:hypothetical protein
MVGDQNMRASDADRQRVADALRRHVGEGRLTLDELSERLGEVYAARTIGQLEGRAGPMRELPPLVPPLSSSSAWAPPPYPTASRRSAPPVGRGAAPRIWILGAAVFMLAAMGSHQMRGAVILIWILLLVGLRALRRGSWSGHGRRHPPYSDSDPW